MPRWVLGVLSRYCNLHCHTSAPAQTLKTCCFLWFTSTLSSQKEAALNLRNCQRIVSFLGFLQHQSDPVILPCIFMDTLQTGKANIYLNNQSCQNVNTNRQKKMCSRFRWQLSLLNFYGGSSVCLNFLSLVLGLDIAQCLNVSCWTVWLLILKH